MIRTCTPHLRFFRYRIDLVDKLLFKLLEARIKTATKVGRIKIALNSPITNPSREKQVISKLLTNCKTAGILKTKDLKETWKGIIRISKRNEGHSVTSFYGSQGSHTHTVMNKYFDSTDVCFPFSLLDEVAFMLYSSLHSIIPFRSNCSGLLHIVLSTLNSHNVRLQNYISHYINQHLVINPSNKSLLSVTQPHAYNQTKQWNGRNNHTLLSIMSTSKAAKVSCICSNMTSIAGRDIVSKYRITNLGLIQDRWNNRTSFLDIQQKSKHIQKPMWLYKSKKIHSFLLTHSPKICRELLLSLLTVIKQNVELLDCGLVYYKRMVLLLCKRTDNMISNTLRMISISKRIGFYINS